VDLDKLKDKESGGRQRKANKSTATAQKTTTRRDGGVGRSGEPVISGKVEEDEVNGDHAQDGSKKQKANDEWSPVKTKTAVRPVCPKTKEEKEADEEEEEEEESGHRDKTGHR
jgi:hypothetical protein